MHEDTYSFIILKVDLLIDMAIWTIHNTPVNSNVGKRLLNLPDKVKLATG